MKLFVKRDLDGFCGLFVDNLVQILLIVGMGIGLCGMSTELLAKVILPGTALSVLVGNVFYAIQAHRLAKRTGRNDVTALPYGINTLSLIVFVFFIIKPEFDRTGDAMAAWRMGLLACLGSGIIEVIGAFIAEPIRRVTPRAALLSTLAGIAIGFISMTFALEIFQKPLISMLPMAIVLFGLFSRAPLPLGLPAGLVAVAVGTATAWLMVPLMKISSLPEWVTLGAGNATAVTAALNQIGWCPPVWCGDAILESLKNVDKWVPFLSVVIPMGVFNIVGSLQNIESAEAAGDRYATMPSMLMNGIGTIVAALFGSCYPTTIYIGHPGWKALGARAGYSTLNGVVTTIIIFGGLMGLVSAIIPVEAGAAIVLWIGIIITAQAFQATPPQHSPAVAVGLFPSIAAWGATVFMGTLILSGGQTLQQIVTPQAPVSTAVPVEEAPTEPLFTEQPAMESSATESPVANAPRIASRTEAEVNGFLVHGMLVMERGYIFTCMILAAASVCLIDRRFGAASVWMLVAAALTGLGAMHAYQVHSAFVLDHCFRFVAPVEGAYVYRADDIAVGYILCAVFFFAIGNWAKDRPLVEGH